MKKSFFEIFCTVAAIASISIWLFVVSGCGKETPEERQATYESHVSRALPPNAANIKYLGNNWVTFELDVAGTKRVFLMRYWYGSHGVTLMSVTELK